MGKEKILKDIQDIAADPFAYIRAKKVAGKKVIGSPLADVPAEMVHAAGGLPVTILGTNEPIVKAGAHLPDNACSLARSNLELVLNYQKDTFDGFVFPQVCDTTQHLSDIWRMTIPADFFVSFLIPRQVDRKSARAWFYRETLRLREQLAGFAGAPVTDAALRESFRLYNRERALLRELYGHKRAWPGTISNREMFDLIRASLFTDPADLIPRLEAFVGEMTGEKETKKMLPVVLSGITVEPMQLLDILDGLGVNVVGDELIVGSRMIENDVSENGDPVEALTARHFAKSPYSPIRDRGTRLYDHLVSLVERTRPAGVIYFHIKFCESQDYDLPDLKQVMREKEMPMIVLDTEYQSVTRAQTKTRLEAFVESLYGEQENG